MVQPSWIGQTLSGRYRIEALLGQGGMSAVYKASDPNLKRVVAIKLIHPHLSGDASFVMRFEEEAAAVAKLRHPNIIQVFDFNQDNGVYYMVLEYIPGETLQERLSRLNAEGRFLPIEQAVKFGAEICDAMQFAHERGMVHRDIKPPNIMLDMQSHAILMDFGIVKIMGGDSHTATGAVVGTARYMAPEVIRGEVADGRSDIYSMGATLYEMLGGRPPFVADSAVTLMMMHLNDPVPDLRKIRPDLPEALVRVLDRALLKDRDLRYPTAGEMAADLRRAPSAPPPVAAATVIIKEPEKPEASKVTMARQASEVALAAQAAQAQRAAAARPNVGSTPDRASSSLADVPSITPPPPPPSVPEIPMPEYETGGQGTARSRPWWIAGAVVVIAVLCCLAVGAYGLSLRPKANPIPLATDTPAAAIASPTSTATVPGPAGTLGDAPASATPTETVVPTATHPALWAQIDSITIDSTNHYVVMYETLGYTPALPGRHVHFFFNTVSPEQAGVPGSGPWILYGGPAPFTGYKLSQRPAGASQMCILVANADHSVVQGSGNCADLPLPP